MHSSSHERRKSLAVEANKDDHHEIFPSLGYRTKVNTVPIEIFAGLVWLVISISFTRRLSLLFPELWRQSFKLTPLFKSCNRFLRMWEARIIDFKREKDSPFKSSLFRWGFKIQLLEWRCWNKTTKNLILNSLTEFEQKPFWMRCLHCSDCGFCPGIYFIFFLQSHLLILIPAFHDCCSCMIFDCSSNLILLKLNHRIWWENIQSGNINLLIDTSEVLPPF